MKGLHGDLPLNGKAVWDAQIAKSETSVNLPQFSWGQVSPIRMDLFDGRPSIRHHVVAQRAAQYRRPLGE
jgi:hypothetical protein